MVLVRRIRATPVRTGAATWKFISTLVDGGAGQQRPYLDRAANVAAMLISEEHTAGSPILLTGCGPRVRIYTIHGGRAVDGHFANELPVHLNRTSDWTISLPGCGADLSLAIQGLRNIDHVVVYDCDTLRDAKMECP